MIVSAPNAYMLPIWYRDAIAKMPGVVAATAERQWGGLYQDNRQPIVSFGIDPDVQEVFPESFLTPDQVKEFLRERRSALVGQMLMEKYHWHVGDWVTLKNGDSKLALSFVIIAQLPGKITQNSFVFRREYFDQAVKQTFGVDITDSASFIAVRVAHVNEIPQVIEEIDGRFRNSEYETSTITESDSIANGVSAIADLSTIILSLCAVVVITVMLVAANSMAISVRERISEVAVIRGAWFRADARGGDAVRRGRGDGSGWWCSGCGPGVGAIRARSYDGRGSRRPGLHPGDAGSRDRSTVRDRYREPRERDRPGSPGSKHQPRARLSKSSLTLRYSNRSLCNEARTHSTSTYLQCCRDVCGRVRANGIRRGIQLRAE